MICSYIKPSGSSASTPLPLAQPALASIDILEICRCCLMLDVLQWVATRLIDTGTLKIESDDDGYLAYILDNKLGLSVANICLALEPCEFPYSAVCFFLTILLSGGHEYLFTIAGTLGIPVSSP
jgi:hypothetical protein